MSIACGVGFCFWKLIVFSLLISVIIVWMSKHYLNESVALVVCIPSLRPSFIAAEKCFIRCCDICSNLSISTCCTNWLNLGCMSSTWYYYSPCDGIHINSSSCDAAAADVELVPLKLPLILDAEVGAIILSICVGFDKSCVKTSINSLSFLC